MTIGGEETSEGVGVAVGCAVAVAVGEGVVVDSIVGSAVAVAVGEGVALGVAVGCACWVDDDSAVDNPASGGSVRATVAVGVQVGVF